MRTYEILWDDGTIEEFESASEYSYRIFQLENMGYVKGTDFYA